MKNKTTYYQLIIDKSGSMSEHIEQTVEGVNQQIRRIKEIGERFPEQQLITSLTLFNHKLTNALKHVHSGQLREISYADYRPDGTTALLDAIGITLNEMQKTIGQDVENDEASAVVVIVTDGYENASQSYTHNQISSMIGELELTGKWTFSYLGATLDAVQIAESLNIKKDNAMHFNMNDISQLYNNLTFSLNAYITDKQTGTISKEFLKPGEDEGN